MAWAKIIDCGDIPVIPIDNTVALEQMTQAYKELGQRRTISTISSKPKLITLGGDHSIALPALRALNEIYGRPIRVLHFDGN
jgi:agmatinase